MKSRGSRSHNPARAEAPAVPRWPFVVAIAVLTLAVFGQLSHAQFLAYDDDLFATANQHVQSFDVAWALTSADLGYYPLTWISHMLDVRFFGLDAGAQHMTNVVLHLLATLVLFFTMLRLLKNDYPVAALIAALFAIHPLHVESVAWISERKDTLSALFGLLAVFVYAKRPRHWLVAALFAASLLAKQTLVTLPLLLLVVDFWPLGRSAQCTEHSAQLDAPRPVHCALCTVHSLLDKWPLFALSIAGTAAAIVGQQRLGAMQSLHVQPFASRVGNAVVSCATYLGKTLWPANLAVIYPFTPHSPLAIAASAVLLIAISAAAWLLRRRAPYLLAGWLWFVIALIPVIGFVQIGRQAMADRYTYLPSIGILIAVVLAAAQLLTRDALAIGGTVVVIALAVVAHHQTSYWRDTPTLFQHSIAVTGPNLWADYILGQSLQMTDPDAALPPLDRAITAAEAEHNGNVALEAHLAAGVALLTKATHEPDAAMRLRLITLGEGECREVLRTAPHDRRALNNLAFAQQLRATAAPVSRSSQSR
jgi:hypothetical protein